MIYKSNRGIDLCISQPVTLPTITVELYGKWYELFIVFPNGCVEVLPFPPHKRLTPYVDHAPNPEVVMAYAEALDIEIDDVALEIIEARYARANDVAMDERRNKWQAEVAERRRPENFQASVNTSLKSVGLEILK
jgi:hypothetical protein